MNRLHEDDYDVAFKFTFRRDHLTGEYRYEFTIEDEDAQTTSTSLVHTKEELQKSFIQTINSYLERKYKKP